jgi:inosine/xanthosine triphosphatase
MKIQKIAVGSTNGVKVAAVEELVKEWAISVGEIVSIEAVSGVSDQPLTLEETIQGAKNRAFFAFKIGGQNCVGVGIESGLMLAPGTTTGYLEATVCCLFDGQHLATGLSCGFEIPPAVLELVLHKGLDLSQACHDQKIGDGPGLGAREGLVGRVTLGHINRKNYTKQAVAMAMGQWQHPLWYRSSDKASLMI